MKPPLAHGEDYQYWLYELMRFIADHTSIPIPNFAVEMDAITYNQYVVEKKVDPHMGKPLSVVWHLLEDGQKHRIVVQLRDILQLLRGIGINKIPHAPCITDRFIARNGCSPLNRRRPYTDNKGFVDILKDSVGAVNGDPHEANTNAKFVKALASAEGNDLVLTHGNINADDIYVSEKGSIVAISNWSESGFYPRYWEFIKARLAYNSEPSFVEEGTIEKVLKPYWSELAIMTHAHNMIW
ncbi:uncharacterized protein CTRU02_211073 [Colletotrichum truncatum]|uniref:Uncharacterized protein n=1 Tax=Colletotrichum truncatum TaxID=5467 RepID=A0ACC3YQS1_COLTU|nr:uncharacterized protein CTRU02_01852 [Colletotrichum truncatum]KAF6798981.1 hypothetical protein CTRU02_01852 [Colletotrichum truncatum]